MGSAILRGKARTMRSRRWRMRVNERIKDGAVARILMDDVVFRFHGWRKRRERVRGSRRRSDGGEVSVDWWQRVYYSSSCSSWWCYSWSKFHRLSWTISASVHVSLTIFGVRERLLWASPFLPICSSAPPWLWVCFSAKTHLKTTPPNCKTPYYQLYFWT